MAKHILTIKRPHSKRPPLASGTRLAVPASFVEAIRNGWRLDGGLCTPERFGPADNEWQESGCLDFDLSGTPEDGPSKFCIELPFVAQYRCGKPRLKSTRAGRMVK